MFTDVWVADSKADALKEFGPFVLYFRQTLWLHGVLGFNNAPSRAGSSPRARSEISERRVWARSSRAASR